MLAFTITSTEQERTVKRLKVDSPSASLECEDDGENSCSSVPHIAEANPALESAQRTPALSKHADTPATEAVNGVSPEVSPANSSRSRHSSDDDDDGKDEKDLSDDHLSSPVARQFNGDTWRVTRTPTGSAVKVTTAITGAAAVPPPPITTNGAITTLRSLGQLQTLVSSTNTTSAKDKVHPSLRLKPGETVMLLLHFDEASLRSLINGATTELSQMRVFTLNLAKLPPHDYEAAPEKRLSAGGCTSSPDASDRARLGGSTATPDADVTQVTVQDTEDEDEEELVPAVHPVAGSTAAAAGTSTIAEKECLPRASVSTGGALALDEAATVSSLSGDLHHASDVISDKLHQMLAVDTILNPHASQQQRGHGSGDGGAAATGKKEPLLFPAMIVWRAAGAPREEYPPAPPQTYSSQPPSTPAELFSDRLSAQGGPLVVKEATGVDQVHSLTLFRPVFTMEHLFRTLVRTVAPSFAARGTGEKSRTVLYLGASWCPPCMRFVREMPQLMREDLPSSVVCTLKADMDLAKPIYDYFKVEIIPTFVVLDNEVLMKCYETVRRQQSSAAGCSGGGGASQSDYARAIQEAFSKAELGRLQNSNRQLVSTFISKHSQALSFDEDF
ncbi:Thioredoxin [Leishmania donovani]|uniref:Thioredoxin family protein n=1 Tax=Leishmania donovani TaxID=5661 RepID=A0A504XDT3_LEIDO|nr:Thioredoxin family protein [Leishmania donovani]CAJ1992852.1 Thioredoxin [Leishmania donovani]VDZ48682.1 Thioredoxin_putative/Pfam:PF00085 [Leishmania donovani]